MAALHFLLFKITTNSVKCPCNVIHNSVTLISALLIESGVICNHWAVELVQEIGRRATLITDEPRESTLLFWKLSIAFQTGNAIAFLNTFDSD